MRSSILVALLCLLWSCAEQESQSAEQLETTSNSPLEIGQPVNSSLVFYQNCQLSSDPTLEREKGDKLVFHYFFQDVDLELVGDDAYSEELVFEVPAGKDHFVTKNLNALNLSFDWSCNCDFPDEEQAKQNEGEIELRQINDSIWDVQLQLENTALGRQKRLAAQFQLYRPAFELKGNDTINRTDNFGRKQGRWIEQTRHYTRNGTYENNEFSGFQKWYRTVDGRKELTKTEEIENNRVITVRNFGEPADANSDSAAAVE